MRALVTGATGFIGGHVARALVASGHQVRVLRRATSDLSGIADLGVEPVLGDLRDRASLARAVHGVRVVFHVGAHYSLNYADRDDILRTNVDGTRALLEVALAEGVDRVVHTSSVAAVGLRDDGAPATEDDEADPAHLVGAYKRSKWLAEREALGLAAARGLDVVVVNPSTPVGWGDAKPTPTGAMILEYLRRRMPAYVDTGLNLVDVEDVAIGHLLALERGRTGRRYILGNRNMTLQAIFSELEAVSGIPAPHRRIPGWVAVAAAATDEFLLSWVLRRPPVAPLAGALLARRPMYFDSTRAVTELGLPQSPIRAALEKAVGYFTARGLTSLEGGRNGKHAHDGPDPDPGPARARHRARPGSRARR